MLLLTETWAAACCWLSACTMSSMVAPMSPSHCSIHVNGIASADPWPCRRRANSATNELVAGGADRAKSATASTKLLGSLAATSVRVSAHASAQLRSDRSSLTRARDARRLSINARRSMIGIAHSSPSVSGVTFW